MLVKNPRIFRSIDDTKVPFISLFLKGETRTGNVFIPVKVTGNTASLLVEKVDQWKVGDEILVEGELDWDGFEKDGRKQYATKINAFEAWRMEKAAGEGEGEGARGSINRREKNF